MQNMVSRMNLLKSSSRTILTVENIQRWAAHVMQNQDESFLSASTGTSVVEGDHYTETTYWSSNPESIRSVTSFTFQIDEDSCS